jgi:hypothetical protein
MPKALITHRWSAAINTTGRLTEENGTPKNAYYVNDGVYFEAGVSVSF